MRRQAVLVAVLGICANCAGGNMETRIEKSYSPPFVYADAETVKFFQDYGFKDNSGLVPEDDMSGSAVADLILGLGMSLSYRFQDARVGNPEKLWTFMKQAFRRIITELGDELDQPVWELAGSRRMLADRALVIASMISDTYAFATSCESEAELGLAEKMLSLTLAGLVDNEFFWEGWWDFAWPGTMPDNKMNLGIYADKPATRFAYRGLFRGMDKSCGETTAEVKLSPAKTVSLKVLSSDWRNVLVAVPTVDSAGIYPVDITFGARRGFRNRCIRVAVDAFLPVTDDTKRKCEFFF